MKNSVIPKVLAWLRSIVFMSIIVFSIAACPDVSLPGGSGGNNPDASRLPEEIRLNMASLTLLVGGKETLTATVLPSDAANKSVNWNSSNSQVATVASNGAVTGLSLGSATITATTAVGGKTATCTVSVTEAPTATPEPTGISLFPPTLSLNLGETDTLAVTVTPSNAAKDVNWKSENPAVVVVDSSGKITAKDAGTATVYAVTVVGGKQASSKVTVNPPPVDVEQVNKYEVKATSSSIKYSVTYGNFDYYYIYLGQMQNIPLFSYDAQKHDGMTSTYTVSKTNTTKESIEKTVTKSSQTTLGVVDTNTVSATAGGKVSLEINAKFKYAVIEASEKIAVEEYWSLVNTNSSSTSTQKTTSLTDTVKNGTEYTVSTQETRSWSFSKSDKAGWYRYTLFSASDVYLYVVKDRTKSNEIYYEFREHVIPDVYFWQLDYSETASFSKSDETRFSFNISMLDNLPKPKSDIAPSFEITFNSNGGSAVSKQTVPFNATVTRPTDPTRSGYSFGGWYKDSTLNNQYDFSTKVIDNITLYAKWNAIWTVSFNANGGSGTVPAAQKVVDKSSITLPSQGVLTRVGFAFVGWTDTLDTGTTYSAGSSYTPTSNITLYAKWVRTSYSQEVKSNDVSIFNDEYLWTIETSGFDISQLRSAGYKSFQITLEYDAKQTDILSINARLWVCFLKNNKKDAEYHSTVEVPAKSWKAYSLSTTVSFDNFDSLIVSWRTSTGGTVAIGHRIITIEAKK
jgi:uncharacterized repeat protein (TIGR02543 family)